MIKFEYKAMPIEKKPSVATITVGNNSTSYAEKLVEIDRHNIPDFEYRIREELNMKAGFSRNLVNLVSNPGVLETVSVEIESLGKTRESVLNTLNEGSIRYNLTNACNITRDASSEMNTFCPPSLKKKILLSAHSGAMRSLASQRRLRLSTVMSGYELVTKPMLVENMEIFLLQVLPLLNNSGDFVNERCAFHVHVGTANNLLMQKNSLKLGLWLDDVLFRIGCVEREFRGNRNNFIYCRPLIDSQIAQSNGGRFYRTVNYSGALKASSLPEFWGYFGVDPNKQQEKYHPSRYLGTNIFAAYLHGTLELRHFGQTFDPSLAIAIVKLTQLFTELSIKAGKDFLSGVSFADIRQKKTTKFYIEKFLDFIDLAKEYSCQYSLESRHIDRLIRAIENSGDLLIENKPVLTHLRNFSLNHDVAIKFDLEQIPKDRLIMPAHVDIHNISTSSILG